MNRTSPPPISQQAKNRSGPVGTGDGFQVLNPNSRSPVPCPTPVHTPPPDSNSLALAVNYSMEVIFA